MKLLLNNWIVFEQIVSEKLTLVIISRLDRIALIFKVRQSLFVVRLLHNERMQVYGPLKYPNVVYIK